MFIGAYYGLMGKMVMHQQATVPAALYASTGGALPLWPIAYTGIPGGIVCEML